jgi:hypothetical protein
VSGSLIRLLSVSGRACGARDHTQGAAHFLIHVWLFSTGAGRGQDYRWINALQGALSAPMTTSQETRLLGAIMTLAASVQSLVKALDGIHKGPHEKEMIEQARIASAEALHTVKEIKDEND